MTIKLQYLSNGLYAHQETWHDDDSELQSATPYTTLSILRNRTAKIIKTKTGFSFSVLQKASALKQANIKILSA